MRRPARNAAALACGCLALFGLLVSGARAEEPPEFGVYRSSIASMSVQGGNGTFGDILSNVLNGWSYTLPLEFVRKGQAFTGSSTRLRRVLNDMVAGAALCPARDAARQST